MSTRYLYTTIELVSRQGKFCISHPKWTSSWSSTHYSSANNKESDQVPLRGQLPHATGGLERGETETEIIHNQKLASNLEMRFGLAAKEAKMLKQEELVLKEVGSVMEPTKRNSSSLEERNHIAAFQVSKLKPF